MNKEILTKVILRNDSTANWDTKNPVLDKGEIGFEFTADGAVLTKVGDGATAWKQLGYSGVDEDKINTLIGQARDNYYSVVRNDGETDNEAIARALGASVAAKGDVCAIKTALGTTPESYSYMGYVFDGENWGAMDGNINSENVIIGKDLVFAGNYTSVGNVSKGTTIQKGKTLDQLLTAMFTQELNPSKPTPSCSVTLTGAGAKEVGETFTPAYTTSFDPKSYDYAPTATGVTATGWEVTDTNGVKKTTATGSFDGFTVEDNTNYKLTAKATYGDGNVPKTNLGNDYPASQIKAGTTAAASSAAVTGYRKWFTYVGTDLTALTSDVIRTKGTSKGAAGTNFNVNLTIPAGTKRVYVAIPASKKKALSSVIDVDGMGLDVKGNFTKQTVSVEGANGYTAVDYDVFIVENLAGLAATTYQIKF